jgi:calcium permeable stress-gated cation channel
VLPDTFFGWIPALYRVTDTQILASAGLDAFAFLSFFKLALRVFICLFIFAAAVLEPINRHFVPDRGMGHGHKNGTNSSAYYGAGGGERYSLTGYRLYTALDDGDGDDGSGHDDNSFNSDLGYLWAYLVFTYFFSIITLYFMHAETFRVISVRQEYLGTQSTITDRTFRLSGIPKELRSEDKIKELVEKLEIGEVQSVMLCRQWGELDGLMADRKATLQKLEETWSVYLSQKAKPPLGRPAPTASNAHEPHDEEAADAPENGQLLGVQDQEGRHNYEERQRPTTRVWYGPLRLRYRRTDALDYYEEKLRRLDEKIQAARKKEFPAADLAFVTMDSIAACQMAIQAVIDPRPGRLLTRPAPAPSDVIWSNTYKSRLNRKARSWLVTISVFGLTIIWLIPVAFFASLLSLCTIRKVFPDLATSLTRHDITRTLVQTGLPTASASLLNIAVPYLYYYLTLHQGMIAQDQIELAAISKNFFFLFFNFFVVFTVIGTASKAVPHLRDALRDTTYLARTLAASIQNLSFFYLNFIMLQGIGLFPFRLLEFGSVAMYPVLRMGSKTPRDYAELVAPPIFNYGFYLPSALLVFILCLVYSTQPDGWLVLLLGIIYFGAGYFTYKYQLLYAMDQPQHATGGAWPMICYRIILGVVVFQLTMSGVLALQFAFTEALLVVPLALGTVWYSYYFRQQFEPLTRFISLRSINRDVERDSETAVVDEDEESDEGRRPNRQVVPEGHHGLGSISGNQSNPELLRRGSTIDEDRERGLKFINPSLILPLEQPWIYAEPPPLPKGGGAGGVDEEVGRAAFREYSLPLGAESASLIGAEGGSRGYGGDGTGGVGNGGGGSNASETSLGGPTNVWRESTPR